MLDFLAKVIGTKSPVFIWVVTQFQGKHVGTDYLGNRYFTGKPRKNYKYERRWVLYVKGEETSQVPPEWHGWLHHQTDELPSNDNKSFRRKWQKPHKPNITGTNKAWNREAYATDNNNYYKAWSPQDKV